MLADSTRVRSATVLFVVVVSGFSGSGLAQATPVSNPNGANCTGAPGLWLDPVAHGDHGVGCNGTGHPFYPIHGALIPKGPYRGCVVVWEKSDDFFCRYWSGANADADQRWAIFDPRTSPPTIHKLAWRINIADAPLPPCQNWPTNTIAPPLGHQGLFCAGHCWLPDGRLLVAGGDYWLVGSAQQYTICSSTTAFAGSRMLAVLDPVDIDVSQNHQQVNGPGLGKPWRSLSTLTSGLPTPIPLREPRWYPSVTLMSPAVLSAQQPHVYISVAGGIETFDPATVPVASDPSYSTHELYRFDIYFNTLTRDPRTGTTPTPQAGLFRGPTTPAAAGLSFFYYPRLHYMSARPGSSDGRLWMSGMAMQSSDGDVINAPETWTNGSVLPPSWIGTNNTMIEEATVVLFPPIDPSYRDVQMMIGGMKTTAAHGGTSANVTNEVVFVPTRGTLGWVPAPGLSMQYSRKFANAVILPDASIVVVGGGTNPGHGLPGGERFAAEMFKDGQWETLAEQYSARTYHSIALLLPDGTVLSAGGDTHADGAEYEILVPPYLQGNPARPVFVGTPPGVIHYDTDEVFQFSAPFGQTIERVALISPGSVTHSQDPNQRYEPLIFDIDPTNGLVVHGPVSPTECPPGHYMMFLVSSAGVPSVAHWVQVMP